MGKKITPANNQANQSNANLGSPGTNRQYDQAQGNRGKQMAMSQSGTSTSAPKGAKGTKAKR